MSSRKWLLVLVMSAASASASASCRPEIEDDAALVRAPRVLAVRAEPAEAKPNEKVSLVAFYTDGTRVGVGPASFRFCTTRRALAEPGPLDPGCLDGSASLISPTPTLPRDACRAFGPDRPLATKAGEPSGRPSDPDSTGGFYQPGIAQAEGTPAAMFEVRLRCALPSVTQDVATAFEQRYKPNQNPIIASVSRVNGSDEPIIRAQRGEQLVLSVSWPAEAAENYVAFDATSRALVDRRESLTVSWLASGEVEIPIARTGRGESDRSTTTENTIHLPSRATDATLFIILRDSRGGVAFTSRNLHVD